MSQTVNNDEVNSRESFEEDGEIAPADWLDAASQEADYIEVQEYDIVSAPNDWNFLTITSFIESGAVKIPPFQRNYVWDIKRASKFIESLILGLPVPQVFLYEERRNSFLVIDGQQRLLSLYFFVKGRFPKAGSRGAVRSLLNAQDGIREDVLHNDELFSPFKLSLGKTAAGVLNRFHGLTYQGLSDYKTTLNLRTIRNVVVKQTNPEGDSAVFEIFSRLNSGGVNLSPQEVRASLYHSGLMSRLLEMNLDSNWRNILGVPDPDPRMRDSEFILRSLALARGLPSYSGSMTAFVNRFCADAQNFSSEQTESAVATFRRFVELLHDVSTDAFQNRQGKFSGVLFESFFAAWVAQNQPSFDAVSMVQEVDRVKSSQEFALSLVEGSTKSINVATRYQLAFNGMAAITGEATGTGN